MPAVNEVRVGADGTVRGVPVSAFDAAPGPTEFTARTFTETLVPLTSEGIVKDPVACPEDVHVPPPSTEYSTSVIVEPPFDPSEETTASVWLPGVNEVSVGAAGATALSSACTTSP